MCRVSMGAVLIRLTRQSVRACRRPESRRTWKESLTAAGRPRAKCAPGHAHAALPSPAPARPHSDPDADSRSVDADSGSVVAGVSVTGIAVITRVVSAVIRTLLPTDAPA